jgi:hypothetical protein
LHLGAGDAAQQTIMRIFTRLFWLFMCAFFSLFAVLTTVGAWRACNSKHWPATRGTVIAFYGKPEYQYSVAGMTNVSSYVSCNEFLNYQLWVDSSARYAVKYPLNSRVTVYYCPSRPDLAVLDTKFDPKIWIGVVIFWVMSGICAAGFIFGWRLRSRRRFWWSGTSSELDHPVSSALT